MENLTNKLKEYLSMDTEIDFKEFQDYYNAIMDKLKKDYQELTEEELLTIRYILNTVAINADNRSARKDKYVKKFRKMAEKTNFWAEAISLKLKKEMGYTQESIEEADERIDKEMRPAQ